MYSQESHGSIALYVISPKAGEEGSEEALAIVPEIFHGHEDDKDNKVTLPARIGSVALHEGNVVHGNGNRGAHDASELALDPQSLYCDPDDSWLDEAK